jgi:hypothetical protein
MTVLYRRIKLVHKFQETRFKPKKLKRIKHEIQIGKRQLKILSIPESIL